MVGSTLVCHGLQKCYLTNPKHYIGCGQSLLVFLNHIKNGNSTKAKFMNEDKKHGFLFMGNGFTSTNGKHCEDD